MVVAMYASARLPKAYSKERYVPQHTSSKLIPSPGLEMHHQTPHGSKLGVWLLYKAFRSHRLFLVFIVLHSTHYSLSSRKKRTENYMLAFSRCLQVHHWYRLAGYAETPQYDILAVLLLNVENL